MAINPIQFELDQAQRSVLVGTLLGDGFLYMGRRSKCPSLRLGHGPRQKDYLIWKASIFNDLFKTTVPREYSYKSGVQLHLASRSHPELLEYHRLFYGTGRKRITPQVLDLVDDVALAVWYGDDGTLCKSSKAPRIVLCVGGLDESEYLMVGLFMRERFGVVKRIGTGQPESNYTRFIVSSEDSERYLESWKDILPDSMSYKLGVN